MTVLDDLLERTLDDGTDRLEWLRARQGRVTASMVGKLLNGGPGDRRKVLEESFEEPVEITGNRYIDRGHEREPVIADWIAKKWHGFQPSARLFGARGNIRHAATPDCVALAPSGELVLGEIKTSKYDRDPDGPDFAYTGYYEQMQWQMYVCDAAVTLFVWEQHDDDWDDGPTPLHPEPRHAWVSRDDAMIARLIETADLLLAERDAMAAERDAPPIDQEIADLAAELLDARRDEAAAKARVKAPWVALNAAMEAREEFSRREGRAMVTWSNRTVTEWQPDEETALTAAVSDPELTGVIGADLYAEMERARDAWQAHLAQHQKQVDRVVRKLTVTEPKPKKDAAVDGEF